MPSHAYFYEAANNPFRRPKSDDDLIDTPERRAKRDAIVAALGDATECSYVNHTEHAYTTLLAFDLELLVVDDYVHVRLPWVGTMEAEERGIVPALRAIERVLRNAVGFDAFEHGCQGLHVPGDIDLVPDYLAGIRGVFAGDPVTGVS